jgi:predicted permease
MDTIAQDIRFGFRSLLGAPAFTLVATLLLTFGTGANIALFAVTDALLLRARPGVRDANRLVWVAPSGRGRGRLSYQDLERFRTESRAFTSIAGFSDQQVVVALESGTSPERLNAQSVTGEYFSVLGTPMHLGRGLGPADDMQGAPVSVVLSYGLWTRRFAADPSAIGRRIAVNGKSASVVGVAPPHFNGADVDEPRQLWMAETALNDRASLENRGLATLITIARLRDGVDRRSADAALSTIAQSIAGSDTALKNFTVRTYSAATGVPPGGAARAAPVVAFSFGVTLAILLIACANVGNLLLARGIVRRREFGVRMAMGATRGRVIRQLLVESGLLGATGTVLGTLAATWTLDAFSAAGVLPVDVNASIDVRVLAGTIVVALAATLLFGVMPAVDATRRDVNAAIKGRIARPRSTSRTHSIAARRRAGSHVSRHAVHSGAVCSESAKATGLRARVQHERQCFVSRVQCRRARILGSATQGVSSIACASARPSCLACNRPPTRISCRSASSLSSRTSRSIGRQVHQRAQRCFARRSIRTISRFFKLGFAVAARSTIATAPARNAS